MTKKNRFNYDTIMFNITYFLKQESFFKISIAPDGTIQYIH